MFLEKAFQCAIRLDELVAFTQFLSHLFSIRSMEGNRGVHMFNKEGLQIGDLLTVRKLVLFEN